MKILIASDSFKESMTAPEAAEAMARGVRRAMPGADVDLCPMADGGEGTVEALIAATGGERRAARVTGPLGEQVEAAWGMLGDGRTAVIEMAQAAGLALVPKDRRDPTRTTTYGVGELIRRALDEGAEKIIIGIGGSATTDGGCGMGQALGVETTGGPRPMTGGALPNITAIDTSSRHRSLDHAEIVVACDVTNPLLGPDGAAAVFGPQKGAMPEQVEQLENGLRHLADLLPGIDADAPGMGAAGGLGFGLVAFCGAKLVRGIDLILDAVGFERRVRSADLVLTGEGRLDGQSIRGKTCIGVAQAADRAGVRTVALAGSLGPDAEATLRHGLHAYHALANDDVSPERAMREGPKLLEELTGRVIRRYV